MLPCHVIARNAAATSKLIRCRLQSHLQHLIRKGKRQLDMLEHGSVTGVHLRGDH